MLEFDACIGRREVQGDGLGFGEVDIGQLFQDVSIIQRCGDP